MVEMDGEIGIARVEEPGYEAKGSQDSASTTVPPRRRLRPLGGVHVAYNAYEYRKSHERDGSTSKACMS